MRYAAIPYTLTTPAGALSLDVSTNLWVEECQFSAAVSAERTKRPQSHGARQDPGSKDGGVWSATARIIGPGGTLETNKESLLKHANSLVDEGVGVLQWADPFSGATRQLTGLRLIEDVALAPDGPGWLAHLVLGAEKPCAEDATATTVDSIALAAGGSGFTIPLTIPFTLAPSGGGSLTVSHTGSFPYAYPVLRAYGPIINPQLINQTTGERIVFVGSIASGDYWEIDLFTPSVKLNGVSSIKAIDTARSTWWACQRGANILQLAGSGYTASTLLRAYMKSTHA